MFRDSHSSHLMLYCTQFGKFVNFFFESNQFASDGVHWYDVNPYASGPDFSNNNISDVFNTGMGGAAFVRSLPDGGWVGQCF